MGKIRRKKNKHNVVCSSPVNDEALSLLISVKNEFNSFKEYYSARGGLYTVSFVSSFLCVTRQRVYQLITLKIFGSVKLFNQLYIFGDDFKRYIELKGLKMP